MKILWRMIRGTVRGMRRAVLLVINAAWTRLLWRAYAAEQRVIRDQQREIGQLRSEVELLRQEREHLVGIHTRDRERIAAETAIQSRRKVEAESGGQGMAANVVQGWGE